MTLLQFLYNDHNRTFPLDHIPSSHSYLYSILFLTLLYIPPFIYTTRLCLLN